jgi:hypothetical protein
MRKSTEDQLVTRGDRRTILLLVHGDDAQDLTDLINSQVGYYLGDLDMDFNDWRCNQILQFAPLNAFTGWLLVSATYDPAEDQEQNRIKRKRATEKPIKKT